MGLFKNFVDGMDMAKFVHVAGHPDLYAGAQLHIQRDGEDLTFRTGNGKATRTLAKTPISDIVDISMNQASAGPNIKKTARGALVGGVLAGGAGALAGAALSTGKNIDQSVVIMAIKQGPMTVNAIFKEAPTMSLAMAYSNLAKKLAPPKP